MISANAVRRRHLTPRQREALILRANGYNSLQAALKMNVSHETVRTHLAKCYRTLDASCSAQAVAIALILREINPTDIRIPGEQKDNIPMPPMAPMIPTKRRCRICKAEEGKQHTINCTFVSYQRHYPRADIYIDVPDHSSSSSSSSCDTGSTDAGSCGG